MTHEATLTRMMLDFIDFIPLGLSLELSFGLSLGLSKTLTYRVEWELKRSGLSVERAALHSAHVL